MTEDEIKQFLDSLLQEVWPRSSSRNSPQQIVQMFGALGEEDGKAAVKAYKDAFVQKFLEGLTAFQSEFQQASRDPKEGE